MRRTQHTERMTISEAVARVDALKPNSFSYAQKLAWLSALDGAVMAEVVAAYEGETAAWGGEYTLSTPPETTLLIPPPYDEAYLRYMEAQMDYANGEYERFNNSNTMYTAAFTAYANHYNRTHMPRGEKKKYY